MSFKDELQALFDKHNVLVYGVKDHGESHYIQLMYKEGEDWRFVSVASEPDSKLQVTNN